MKKRKSKSFTFICSFLPGAAEMYMGLMKMGVSLMGIFFLCLLIPSALRVSDIFVLPAALIWFYSFFHARNIAALHLEEFEQLKDEYIWAEFMEGRKFSIQDGTKRKWTAWIFIIFGLLLLWRNFMQIMDLVLPGRLWDELYPLVSDIPQGVLAIVCIIAGIRLIIGKKEEIDGEGK